MIRVLFFFGVLFLAALGFAWLADLPGTISIQWVDPDPSRVPISWEQPPAVAAVVVGVLLALFLAVVWAIRLVLKSPQIASRFFRRRKRDKGYEALSQGLLALGTGNAKLARRHGVDADRLLADEPAAKLLLAQTAQLAGKDDEARARFEAMLDDPSTRALGLHGLFVEAERHREPVAARHYAEEAAKASPGLEWAGKAVLGYQAVAHDWDAALKTLEANYAAKLIDKKTYRRQRAVILTALARELEDGEPERAYALAKEAHGLALDLVPAAVVTSRLATRRGDVRKASKVLEATWRLFPHPDLAETYAHVRTGDSAVDRLKRVRSLSAQRANTAEGALAIARAALEAREFEEARAQLKKVLQSEPTRKAFVLMAEVEETEHGDRGRMRDWLARAVTAPMDKVWMADGVISAEWQAVSPVTGKLDAFRWVTPDSLREDDEAVLDDSLFDAPRLPARMSEAGADPVKPVVLEPAAGDDAALTDEPVALRSGTAGAAAAAAAGEAAAAATEPTVRQGYEGTTDDVRFTPDLNDLPETGGTSATPEPLPAAELAKPAGGAPSAALSGKDGETGDTRKGGKDAAPKEADGSDGATKAPARKAEAAAPASAQSKPAPADKPAKSEARKADLDRPIEFALSRMPDDPGPDDEDDTPPRPPRPRFFN